jgi:hypothetical protein
MSNEYKDEYFSQLKSSKIYQALTKKCDEKDSEVIALVDSAVSYAYQRTKTIIKHMGEYTLHDGDHLFRVLHLMERLLTVDVIEKLSAVELQLLIMSAFFHDIGMAPDEKDVLTWKKEWDFSPDITDEEEMKKLKDFSRFCNGRPEQIEIIQRFTIEGKHSNAETLKAYLITEFIRLTHADRARDIISRDWEGKIKFRDTDLTVEFAEICYSHNEDPLTLLELDKNHLCAPNTFACLPLIAMILRIADILDFDAKRTPSILYSHLYVRHPISISEWEKHRAIQAWEIRPDFIQFKAVCNHPEIEASIHKVSDYIDQELSVCNNLISELNYFNGSIGRDLLLRLPLKVNREKIKTKKDIRQKPLYLYRDTQFNLSKKQVIELLMGTKLYGNPDVALRELLQNSIDACLLRQAQESKWGNPYTPEISVKYRELNGEVILEVIDNGTGMDQHIIDNYYSKVGSSFYKSTDFYNLKAETNTNFTPTSRFGIGILSCFMIADVLEVDTKRVYGPHRSSDALNITVEGQESIFWIKDGKREVPGTSTKLVLRKVNNPWDKLDGEKFIKSIKSVIPNPPVRINIETDSESSFIDQSSFVNITTESMQDYSWREHENIRFINIIIDEKIEGIIGSITVAILESHKAPEREIEIKSVDVQVNGETFTLDKYIKTSENSITEMATTIGVNDDGEVIEEESQSTLTQSRSVLSLHGIEIPTTLFPPSWAKDNNQPKLAWPFPLLIKIDVSGEYDLDLNSPRTQIIMSDKWMKLEKRLAILVCKEIAKSVDICYWIKLRKIFLETTKNEIFIAALEEVVRE